MTHVSHHLWLPPHLVKLSILSIVAFRAVAKLLLGVLDKTLRLSLTAQHVCLSVGAVEVWKSSGIPVCSHTVRSLTIDVDGVL